MGTVRRVGVALLMACACVCPDRAAGQSPARAVEDLLSSHVDARGYWRQDNAEFQPGSGLPAYWVRRVGWGPAREVVLADAFAVSEEGRCEPVAHMVYFWDVQHDRVAVNSFNAAGVRGQGYLESSGPSGTQLQTTIGLPDGTALQIREYSDTSRPEAVTTHPERLVEGTWIADDSVTWRRVRGVSPCG